MADRNRKAPRNVPGKFYVDDTCIDCDLCREIAPQSFTRDEETGTSYVYANQRRPTRSFRPRKRGAVAPRKRSETTVKDNPEGKEPA